MRKCVKFQTVARLLSSSTTILARRNFGTAKSKFFQQKFQLFLLCCFIVKFSRIVYSICILNFFYSTVIIWSKKKNGWPTRVRFTSIYSRVNLQRAIKSRYVSRNRSSRNGKVERSSPTSQFSLLFVRPEFEIQNYPFPLFQTVVYLLMELPVPNTRMSEA